LNDAFASFTAVPLVWWCGFQGAWGAATGQNLGRASAQHLNCAAFACIHFLGNMTGFRTSPTFSEAFSVNTRQVAHKSACSITSIEIPLLLGAETPYLPSRQSGSRHHGLGRLVSGVLSCQGPGPDATTTSSSHL